MSIRQKGQNRPLVVDNVRSFVLALENTDQVGAALTSASADLAIADSEALIDKRDDFPNPVWLDSWRGVYLGDSETFSLGHQFFTRTTVDQENALNNPRGLTFVEGIAGAGKTSVALGRLKFFSNFATGSHLEDYGLQNANPNDFSPVGMVGFVLSHSLKRYLKETAAALGLERLSIRDFPEFRTDLSNQFNLSKKFRRRGNAASPYRTRVAWLRALDLAMARIAGERLRSALTRNPNVSKLVEAAVAEFVEELSQAKLSSGSLHLAGLANRLVAVIADADFKDREKELRERVELRRDPVGLEKALQRLEQEADRRQIPAQSRRFLELLTSDSLVIAAVGLDEFASFVRQSFGDPTEPGILKELESAILEFKNDLADKNSEGTAALTDSDMVALIALSATIADGFDFQETSAEALAHLYQVRKSTAVFIDEVQDFTEIEVYLMGLAATSGYNQITLSGDRCQRLQSSGAENYESLFPSIPRSRQNKTVFLNYNFRQRDPLATLSAGFRFLLQHDERVSFTQSESASAILHTFNLRHSMAKLIVERIRGVDPYATVAVILPTVTQAREWHKLLEDDLAAYHRPALLSQRDDLTRRFEIHFTDARETKGLEFNVVVVPDLGAFALDTSVGLNEAYVAISRAKESLLLGCDAQEMLRPEIAVLIQHDLIRAKKLDVTAVH